MVHPDRLWTVAMLVGAGVIGYILLQLLRTVARTIRIGRGLTDVPVAPGGNPLIGHVLPLLKGCPWDIMSAWALQQKQHVVRLRVLQRHMVVLGSPEALRRVLQTGVRHYVKDTDFSYKPFMPILGTGLVSAQGDLWQHQRLLMAPTLRVHALEDVIGVAYRAAERVCAKLGAAADSGRPVDMEEVFRLMTLQVIGEAVLSLPPEECDRVFPQLYLPVMAEANLRALRPWRAHLPLLPAFWQFRACTARLDAYIKGRLRARWKARHDARPAGHKPDIVDRLFAAIEAEFQSWSAALETQLCYEVKTFLLAGHETSAAMLTWTFYELTQHPNALARVTEEADAAFGAECAEPSRAAAEGMAYTLSVLKETLRRYTVVPMITRRAAADDVIAGMRVPEGAYLAVSLQTVHALWAQPSAWRPERHLPGGEYDAFDADIRPYMFVPFIQGPRNCLGQYFALLEARIVVGLLVKRFSFKYASPLPPTCHQKVIPVGPAQGMEMFITRKGQS